MDVKIYLLVIKILKVLIMISLLVFLIVFLATPEKTNCEKCKIEYNGSEYDGRGIYNLYFDKCLDNDNKFVAPNIYNLSLKN
jgi:hypothetical protein